VGYTFGSPTEFIPKDMEYQEDVSELSDIYNYEDNTVDICSGIYASICGVGYMITLPSSSISKDMTPDIPIVHSFLDPRNTFVVQSTEVGNPTILSCNYVINRVTGKKDYTCYTDKFKFEFSNMNPDTLKVSINPIGKNPISMVPNSLFLTGDWEQAIAVMNAQNQVTSDGLNDIEGTIKSILVILGAEFEDDDTGLKDVKEKRVLTLTKGNGESGGLNAKFIAPKLDSVSVENIRDYLEKARNVITGIPDRSANSSGGDTGMAVLNRDGWTDIEIVARLKEMFYKNAKKEQLSVGIEILKKLGLIRDDLSVLNIDLSVGRHTTDNIQTKTQAFSTLVATGELATIDALEMTCLTNKAREVVERGEKFRKERQEEADERFAKQQENANNQNDNKNGNQETTNEN
jgi:SPP1 family phage portal protein